MRRTLLLLMSVIGLAALLCSCAGGPGAGESQPWPDAVEYSNLSGADARELAERMLDEMAVGEKDRRVFFEHVDQINSYLEPEERADGFETGDILEPKYDPYDIQARWDADHPYFPGYNCRITAFSLFQGLIHIEDTAELGSQDYIMMDMAALEEDPSAIPTETALQKFKVLYGGIETEDTKDLQVHLRHIQESWADRGISFETGSASLISVFFHDQLDGDHLSVGHTGILMELDGQLYFLEKLSFQEPYQLVRVSSRSELSDYLMTKYDVEFNQPTARPMILENEELIEGYRTRPDA